MAFRDGDTFSAEIIDITKAPSRDFKITARARFVDVEDNTHDYVFILGSIGAPRQKIEVGDKGTMTWRVGPSSALWFWQEE